MHPQPSTVERALAALRAYYERWRSLTEAEGDAIRSGLWQQVDQLQETKRQLQQLILGATRELRAECARCGVDPTAVEQQLRSLVEQLVQLESRNGQSLAEQLHQTRTQLQQLDAVGHNLNQIRRAYSPTREANWESFS
jgi:DNA anti-recombination protein RmuC